jgi:hypothetical protein
VNIFEDTISVPEKSDSFQGLMLDLYFVCTKCLVNCIHVIAPDALPVHVVKVYSNILVSLPSRFLLRVMMPETVLSHLLARRILDLEILIRRKGQRFEIRIKL